MSVDKNNIIHCAFCFADLVWFFLLRIELICFLKYILLKIHVESTLQGCAILIAFLVSAVFHEVPHIFESSTLHAPNYHSYIFPSHQLRVKMAWFPFLLSNDLGSI